MTEKQVDFGVSLISSFFSVSVYDFYIYNVNNNSNILCSFCCNSNSIMTITTIMLSWRSLENLMKLYRFVVQK